jgi:hypothetical protein
MTLRFHRLIGFAAVGGFLIGTFATTTYSSHSLGKHWARQTNPFTLQLGDNVSGSDWDALLVAASNGWSVSDPLDTLIVPGGATKGKCQPTKGRVEVCTVSLGGSTLGKASLWTTGGHITQAIVQVNDYLLNGPFRFNSPAWRQYVICQEIGHTLGLDHQDEDTLNPNLGTCMDYTEDPGGVQGVANTGPDFHDYEELRIIYSHLDSVTTVSTTPLAAFSRPSPGTVSTADTIDLSEAAQLGTLVRKSRGGQEVLYERDLGNGNKILTFVLSAN